MRSRKYLSKVVVTVGEPGPHRNANAVRRTALLVLVSFVGLAAPSRSYAAVRTVCASGCKYTNIAAAIAAAKAGDTISILDAVHTESNITVDRSLTIQGQGAAKTAVDGAQNGTVFTVDAGVTATFRNLTIRNGLSDASGGGILNLGTLSVFDSTFSSNSAALGGGGIWNEDTMTVTNSNFSNNGATGGGGIGNPGTLTVIDSTFSGNGADGGGGIVTGNGVLPGGSLTVINSTLSGNDALDGGGILNNSTVSGGGTLTVINSTF